MGYADPFATPGSRKESLKWNYTKPNEPGYCEAVTGDIVEIRQIQTKNHQTQQYEFWPDGNPKLSMLLVIDSDELGGEFPFVFVPKGFCADAIRAGMKAVGIPDGSWANLAGKNVTIMTNNEGAPYGSGRPRPWTVSVNGDGTKPFRGCFTFEPPKQPQPQQQRGGYQQQPGGYQQQPQQWQQPGQPVQQQFANPQLQHAFNNASQAVHNAQFQTPSQGYQQAPQQFQQNPNYQQLSQAAQMGQQFQQQGNDWGSQDYYSEDCPF